MSEYKKILDILEKQNNMLANIEKILKHSQKSTSVSPKIEKPVRLQHKKTTIPALLLYLKEDNFFMEPRTLNDIVRRLSEESRNVKSPSLTLPLQKLVRSRELGRLLKNGKWHYVAR